jgi:hypothetical protein
MPLAKAQLIELDADFKDPKSGGKQTIVQFNPDSLKVSFANQLATPPSGSGDKNGPQALQFVGAGTTKLAATLVFDVTSEIPTGLPVVNDVRRLTQLIAYFITAKPDPPSGTPKIFIPPAVRFQWGSFQFDGVMESMEETLELFSFEGRPLRATVGIGLTQQKITAFQFNKDKVPPPPAIAPKVGTSPLTEAPAGSSLQSLAANQGGVGPTGDWQSIASANNIENPRLLQPGQLIDLSPPSVSVQVG